MIDWGGFLSTALTGGTMGFSMASMFLMVRWLANFIGGRLDRREDRIDAGRTEWIDGLKQQVEILTTAEKELREELRRSREEFETYRRGTDEELRECRRRHAESEAEVMQLKAMLQGYGDAKQIAQLMIAADKQSDL